jgi:hypothetical protein
LAELGEWERTSATALSAYIYPLVSRVDVTLYWHPALDELIVSVYDERDGAHFEIRPQRSLALDVYYHPYAYADPTDAYDKENRRAPKDDNLERSMAEQPWTLGLQPPAEGRQ